MSDPRPHLLADLRHRHPDRVAVAVRAAIKSTDAVGGVPFWPAHMSTARLAQDKAWADYWIDGGTKTDSLARLHVKSRHDWMHGVPRGPEPWQPLLADLDLGKPDKTKSGSTPPQPWPPKRKWHAQNGAAPASGPLSRNGETVHEARAKIAAKVNAAAASNDNYVGIDVTKNPRLYALAQGVRPPRKTKTPEELARAAMMKQIAAIPPQIQGGDYLYEPPVAYVPSAGLFFDRL